MRKGYILYKIRTVRDCYKQLSFIAGDLERFTEEFKCAGQAGLHIGLDRCVAYREWFEKYIKQIRQVVSVLRRIR